MPPFPPVWIEEYAKSLAPILMAVGPDRTRARIKAAERGSAPYIVFIDADAQMEDPALLTSVLARLEGGAGVVGGLLIGAQTGKVAAAGYAIAATGQPYFRFAGWDADHPKVQQLREDLQAVPFPFLATTRSLWRRYRLRPEFGSEAFAEADYCIRLCKDGHPVIYDPAIRVHISGRYLPRPSPVAVQFLLASAQPLYDEFRVL